MSEPGGGWTRWRVRLSYPVALVAYLLAHPTPRSIVLGAAIAALGILLRGVAAGHLRKGEQLATSGPYGYTRNPLYLGSALLAAGCAVASHSFLAAVVLAGYFIPVYAIVVSREEYDLRAAYGEAFDDYARRVPRFWPRWKPGMTSKSRFSWKIYRRNREYQAALGWLAGVGLLWLRMYGPLGLL